tara:strand:+ start:920 stop:1963 length:1044 start_codon:yes stop_codon:yes gene_type:complete
MLPKKRQKDINITPNTKIDNARLLQIYDNATEHGTYLPKPIDYEDMDAEFIKFIDEEIDFQINGEKVPVVFLTAQRWAEFTKTWQHTDKYKNMKIPFITIVRKPEIQQGTMVAQAFNIPGKPRFSYFTVKTWNGNIEGADVYQIPQPVPVDLSYEVRLFSFRLRELNSFNKSMVKQYSAKQKYLKVKNAYFPTTLETIGDESTINDFENRRYYVQLFDIKLMGYILDGEDFVIKPAISRAIILTEVQTDSTYHSLVGLDPRDEDNKEYLLNISFEIGAANTVTYTNSKEFTLLGITSINTTSITITIDGVPPTYPTVLVGGETVVVTINRDDDDKASLVTLRGLITS